MKKLLYIIFFIFIFSLTSAVIYLSIVGIKTSKFNNLIIKEIKKKEPKIELRLEKIKIKFDIKKIQLFASTKNPQIIYQGTIIPVIDIKVYTKINKILRSKIEVTQIVFSIKNFNIQDVKKIAIRAKPSNFKTYLLNNINEGKIEKALFDLNINNNFKIIDYKVNGTIKKINAKIKNNFKIKNIGFNFVLDKNLTLINSVNATYKGFSVSNGSVELQKKKEIEIKGKFNSRFTLNENQLNKFFSKVKFFKENKIETKGSIIHEFNLKINESFKVIDYDYRSFGNISQSEVNLKKNLKSSFINGSLKKILFKKTKLEIILNKKNKNYLLLEGLFSIDDINYRKFNIKRKIIKKNQNYFIDFNLPDNIFVDIINFRTNPKKISNIKTEFTINNNDLTFKSIDFTEGKNYISIEGLKLNNKNEIKNLTSIRVLTFNKSRENNNFTINFKNKISISGEKYDSTNLLKLFSRESSPNLLKNFNKEIEIQLKQLVTQSKIPLSNFNLIGLINKGEFSKLSAKSEFSKDKYLDISLTKDPNNKTLLEVYSDIPQALLSNYKFFDGVAEGKLLYNSVIDKKGSASKLTIENFKVTEAPTFATLLTLADLSGVADLLSGQGMSFEFLEINMRDDKNLTNVDEILALGRSVSLQMSGYIDKKTGLISFSGTLVPAKTLNNLVSKIPVVGNILVGDKVGEGVFGVSFKIKGLPGKIKTTVNPVKTITPRFITRALEKMKKK